MAPLIAARAALSSYALVLCEGDESGHESTIYRRWFAACPRLTNRFVEVWPCGTSTAIYGMADAYGRKSRVLVLEDRDFRALEAANSDCQKKGKDRLRRAVKLIDWKALCRNEIENYLLEPDCLHPVLTEVFGCTTAEVEAALDEVLPSLWPYQVLQAVQYRTRIRWEATDPAGVLLKNTAARPLWQSRQSLSSPDPAPLRQKLLDNAKTLVGCELDVDALARDFDATQAAWAGMTRQRPEWLLDWAGKEVLSHLLMLLSARFGLPDESGGRQRLDFSALNSARRGALYRERLEPILHPLLDQSFLRLLQAAPAENPIAQEFTALETLIASYRD